jgi:sugar lactone lactonase YvrE
MSTRRLSFYLSLAFLAVVLIGLPIKSQVTSQDTAQTETIISGRNVNMVSGTTLPGGDPWLQRQNEPSIAVSTRNPLHLLAGANDYRTVDMPVSEGELPGKVPTAMVGDAWLGVFTSYDGGESWVSTMLPGYPQDPNANPLKNYRTAADPVVRSGPNGLFYYSGIAFNRDTNLGVVFVARFIDNNNKEGGNSIKYIDTKIIASGTATKFLDKPWIAVDQPRFPFTNITIAGQTFPRHNVYIGYSSFSGTTVTLGDIMFVRSTNCGTTWGTPLKISTGSYAHQGATIAIKPVLGEVLVAWRRFGTTNKSTDSIFVAQSFSRGLNFQSPVKVADIPPFDQPTTDKTQSLPGTLSGPAFRTNSYPTITVDKSGHVYLAWSQRGVGAGGGARIMLSSSYLGSNWTSPQPVDPGALSFLGHQIMPSLSFAAGKLILVWYDQRHDVSGAEYGFNNWILDDMPYRHTMDVWAGEADTDTYPNLAWNFSQVSRYLYSVLRDESGDIIFDSSGNPIIFPVQFNCVNYPLFKGGQVPFDGDYIDVAASPEFVMDNWRNWIFNTESSNSPVFHVAWTDNRDVRPPLDGDWTVYTPPGSTQDPSFLTPGRPECSQGGNAPGMRNQNIYTSRITWGIEAGSPTNDKPLNLDVGRAFVVFVKNSTEYLRSFRLTIASQPPGGQASFLQFELLATLDVNIAPYSTISRPVFINSSDINASVTINIDEIDASGNIIAGGLKSSVLINGDPTNPNVLIGEETHNPNIVNQANPNIVNWYVNPNIVNPNIVNPNIVNPNIVNPNIVNPNIVNPNIVNPNIVNPNIVNPNIVNPNIVNRDVPNPNIVNPNIVNPNIVNPNIVNASLEDITIKDVEWTVRNDGNATTSFTLKALAKKSPPPGVYAQLLVYRVHYTPAVAGAELSSAEGISACELKQEPHHELVLNVVNPNIVNPNIVNPNIVNPNIVNSSIENATFSVAPGEEVIVDLRVLDTGVASSGLTTFKALSSGPSIQALNVQDFIDSLGFAVTSQAVNSDDAAQGIQTPPAAATTLVIGTSSLPDGVVGIGYNATLSAYGGTAGYAWILNSGELPPGLTLSSGGLISGTPTTEGTYYFIVRVDSGDQFDTQQYSIIINPTSAPQPLQITTTSLPSGVQGYSYGATLEATGGVWPRTWSLAGGSLPPGLSLDSGGVISGTPTAEGTSSFTVRVRDKSGTTATQPLSILISASTSTYYNITGTVYDEYGYPLSDVVLRGLPNTPTTDTYGNYQDKVPEGWSGTVIPFKANVAFSPPSRTYQNVTASFSQQNYNEPVQIPVSTISGRVMYDGNPVSQYSSKQASFWARNEVTGLGIQITPTYNLSDGTYSIPNIPSGTYGIQVYIDEAAPNDGKYLPGDFWGWTSPIVVNAPNSVNIDLTCQKIMHLTSPIDNNSAGITPLPPPYDAFFSPLMFQWDAIGEAATYSIRVDRYQNDPYQVLQSGVINESGLTATQRTLTLPVCGTNEHYEFNLYAYSANNVFVGQLMVYYSNGFGWDYRFRIIAPQFPPGTILTVAGSGTEGFSGDGGAATNAQLNSPNAIAIDSAGDIYIADDDNNRIRKVNVNTGVITTVAGNGSSGFSGDGGLATDAELSSPRDVALDSQSNLYIADFDNHRIRRVDAATGLITTVVGNGAPACYDWGDGGLAVGACLGYPLAVAVDNAGNIYIATGNKIRWVNANTGIIDTLAGDNGAGYDSTSYQIGGDEDGPATAASLYEPWDVVLDGQGNIYIASYYDCTILRVNLATGIITTAVGVLGNSWAGSACGFGGDGGPAILTRPEESSSPEMLRESAGVIVGSDGNLYIADTGNHRLRKVDASTGIINTIAGNGTGAFSGDGGPATSASLYEPRHVAVDSQGNIYIADTRNHRIRKVIRNW